MAATKGNRFWEARAKHGRDKIFKTPKLMLEAAFDYFSWVEDNPLTKAIIYQGVASADPEKLMRAMTIKGLCIYWGVNTFYLNDFVGNLNLEKEEDKDFSQVISTIKEIIETQKFEGASAGLLNPNIIARDLGLTDKKELSGSAENPLTLVIQEISGNTLGPSND
tara:strand:- start:2900 stop:3394 length:495 start_codon:yes stop_codon:yes gene_type:complete